MSLGIAAISGVASGEIRIAPLVPLNLGIVVISDSRTRAALISAPTGRDLCQHSRREHIDKFIIQRNDI